jgi:tetratricopeptide (TPR) repeat protein
MNSRWQRVRDLFERAAESSSPDAVLDAGCAGDVELRAEIEKLLALRHRPGLAIDSPAFKLEQAGLSASPGDVIGRYRITKFLASGGMGEVYAAIDGQSGDPVAAPVAMKVLRQFSNVARDREQLLARFEREADLASRIQHPNVCRMHGVDLEADPPYCVMDLLEGETLAERIARDGRLPTDEALRIACGICDGLDAAHGAGVIHRDLKPGNIFLLAGSGRPVIIDFGLATAVQQDLSLTKSGDMLGTLAYMAPEILEENRAAVGPASDLYSLGVILFEMLTGKKPHAAESPLRLVMQRARRTDLLPAMRSLGLPPVWLEVIARCLESDPARRFASAGEVRERLQSGRVSWRFRLAGPQVRWAVVASAAMLAACLGWWLWTYEYRPGAEAEDLYRAARRAVFESAPRRAVGLLEQAVQRDPSFLVAHSLLAYEYAVLDQVDKAREEMLKATAASDRRWRVGPLERRALDASRAAVVGDYRDAARLYRELAASTPERALFEHLEANILSQMGKTDELLRLSERLVREDPDNYAAKVRYGQTLCRRRKFKEAAVEFEAAEKAYAATANLEGLANVLLAKTANLRREDAEDRRDMLRVRELAAQTGDAHQDLQAIFRLALIDAEDEKVDEAIQAGSEAVTRAQSLGMNGIASRALGDIGFALYLAKRQSEARRFLEEGVQLAQRSKNASAEASNRMRLSEVLFSPPIRRIQEAIEVMRPAADWYRQAGHEDVLSNVLVKWGGMLLNDPPRIAEGEKILLEVVALAEKEGDQTIQVMAIQRLAGIYGSRDLPKSLRYWNRVLPLVRSLGSGVALVQIARTYSFFGDFASARAFFEEVDRMAANLPQGYNRKNLEAWSAREKAMASYRAGACTPFPGIPYDPPYAEEYAAFVAECLPTGRPVLERHRLAAIRYAATFVQNGDHHGAGRLWNIAARMSIQLGDLDDAERYAGMAIAQISLRGEKVLQLEAELALRSALRRKGDSAKAREASARVLRIAREAGFPEPYERFNGRKDLQRLWEH